MSIVTVTLSEPLERFVEDQVASGAYPDAAGVVQASLLRLQSEQELDVIRMQNFLDAAQVGIDQFERGEYIVVEDLEAFFDGIEAEIDAETAREAA